VQIIDHTALIFKKKRNDLNNDKLT
jgi:hypothetical protein